MSNGACARLNTAIDMRAPSQNWRLDQFWDAALSFVLHGAVFVALIWAPHGAPSASQKLAEAEAITISVIALPADKLDVAEAIDTPIEPPPPEPLETKAETLEARIKEADAPPLIEPEKKLPPPVQVQAQTTAPVSAAKTKAQIIATGTDAREVRYLDEVKYWLEKHKIYPRRSRMKGLEGEVTLTITFTREGQITSQKLITSSGHDILDKAAMDTLKAASPLPSMPPSLRGNTMTLNVPFGFFLAGE